MNAAEIKLDLFRKIDNLNDDELERFYQSFLALINPSGKYKLSSSERKAIDEALEYSKKGESLTTESVLKEATVKYPRLKFK